MNNGTTVEPDNITMEALNGLIVPKLFNKNVSSKRVNENYLNPYI